MKKVKTKLTYLVEGAEFGSAGDEGDERLAARETFDTEGRSVEVIVYDNRGEEQEITLRKYDAQGRLTEEVTHDIFTDSYDKRTWRYDDVTRAVEEVQYYGDDPGERTITRNDDKGQPLEIMHFDVDEQLESRHVFTYTDNGLCVRHEEFTDDELTKATETEFDEAGRPVREVVTVSDDPHAGYILTTAYSHSTVTSEAHSIEDQLLWREVSTHSEEGLRTETVLEHFIDPTKSHRVIHEYENGEIVLAEQYNDSGDLEFRQQRSYEEGLLTEEAVFYSASYRGVATHTIRRFRYEWFE